MWFHSFARGRNDITPRATQKDNKETRMSRTALSQRCMSEFQGRSTSKAVWQASVRSSIFWFPLNNPIRECRMDRLGADARILFSASCALLLFIAPAGRADGVSFSSRQAIGDRRRTPSRSMESASLQPHSTAAICLPRIPIRTRREWGWRAIPAATTRFSQEWVGLKTTSSLICWV
jgi:hypothetical protein